MNVKRPATVLYCMYLSMGHELLNKDDFAKSTRRRFNTNNLIQTHSHHKCWLHTLKGLNKGNHFGLWPTVCTSTDDVIMKQSSVAYVLGYVLM